MPPPLPVTHALFGLFLVLASWPVPARSTAPDGADETDNNPEVRRKAAALRRAEAEVRRLDAVWANPVITIDGAVTPEDLGEHAFGASVEQQLPLWNARGPAVRAARARVQAAKAEVLAARSRARAEVAAARERTRIAAEEVAVLAELEAFAARLAAGVAAEAAQGQASLKDTTVARLEAARAAAAKAEAVGAHQAEEAELCRVLGVADGCDALVATRSRPAAIEAEEALVAHALAQRTDLLARMELARAAVLELRASERTVKLEPSIGIGVERERSIIDTPAGPLTDGDWLVTASLSLPLPFFTAGAGEVALARAARVEAEVERQIVELEVVAEVRSARARAAQALLALEAFDGLEEDLDRALRDLTAGFDAGSLSLSALLTERDRVVRGRLDIVRLERAWVDARLALETAIGGPLP
ncbi:MAG: TolC family protein [Deltaproteobacteria bacterium]|nr:TolC family protein [Deltaproteobacteria bacterium]